MSVIAARGGRVELTAEQLEQPVEQPATPAVHTARSAQLPHGLPIAHTRAAYAGSVTIAHAYHFQEVGIQLSEGHDRRRGSSTASRSSAAAPGSTMINTLTWCHGGHESALGTSVGVRGGFLLFLKPPPLCDPVL